MGKNDRVRLCLDKYVPTAHCAETLGDKVQVYDTSMNDNIITNANS